MKFIADAMLGRLAKRLRLLGFDVLYDPAADDNEILRHALEEERTILTRDSGLASRPLARHCLFISSDHLDEQLGQFRATYPALQDRHPLTRCTACNNNLDPIDRELVRDLVPDHVYRTTRTFQRCSRCGKVYWQGSHVRRMRNLWGQRKKGRQL